MWSWTKYELSNITLDECLVWDGPSGELLVWEILLRDIIIISGSRLLGLRYVLQPHLVLCTALRHYTSTEEYFVNIIKCVTAAISIADQRAGPAAACSMGISYTGRCVAGPSGSVTQLAV